MGRPYILAESTWSTIKEASFDLAVLPWGATEAHNYHLPYGTDNFEADGLAVESARIAWEKGARLTVLPTIPFGVNTGQMDIAMDMNLYPSTQLLILDNLIEVLNNHGVKKLVVFNSHGGNDFKTMLRELGCKYPEMFLCQTHWFKAMNNSTYFVEPGDHADEMETSLMMHLVPHLVEPLDKAGDGKEKKIKIKALSEGWAWTERPWSIISQDTGVGNPKQASAEKGARFFKDVTEKMGQFFYELAVTPIEKMYD
jgi:creatinine amidohydrolase